MEGDTPAYSVILLVIMFVYKFTNVHVSNYKMSHMEFASVCLWRI